MFNNAVARTSIARTSRVLLARPSSGSSIASRARFQSNGPTSGTTGKASGPNKVEQSPQGSDQRGQATTYALPITAAALVAFALTVRATRSDTKKNAINVGVNTDGADKLQSSSKARGIETAKANAEGLN